MINDLKRDISSNYSAIKAEYRDYENSLRSLESMVKDLEVKVKDNHQSLFNFLQSPDNIFYNSFFYSTYTENHQKISQSINQDLKNMNDLKKEAVELKKEFLNFKTIHDETQQKNNHLSENLKNLLKSQDEIKNSIHRHKKDLSKLELNAVNQLSILEMDFPNIDKYKKVDNQDLFSSLSVSIQNFEKNNRFPKNIIKFFIPQKDEQFNEFKMIEKALKNAKSKKTVRQYIKDLSNNYIKIDEINFSVDEAQSSSIHIKNSIQQTEDELKGLDFENIQKKYQEVQKIMTEKVDYISELEKLKNDDEKSKFIHQKVTNLLQKEFRIPSYIEQCPESLKKILDEKKSFDFALNAFSKKLSQEKTLQKTFQKNLDIFSKANEKIQSLKDKPKVNEALRRKNISTAKMKKSSEKFRKILKERKENNQRLSSSNSSYHTDDISMNWLMMSSMDEAIDDISILSKEMNGIEALSFDFSEISSIADAVSDASSACSSGPSCSSCSSCGGGGD